MPKKIWVFISTVCILMFASDVFGQKPPRPVRFDKVSDIAFGTFTYTTGGRVTVNTDGSCTPGPGIIHMGGNVSALVFTVSNGRPGTRVSLTLSPIVMTGQIHNDDINLVLGPVVPGLSFVFPSAAPITLRIGGEMDVPYGVHGDIYNADFVITYHQD